jgi:hypothetical protein
MQREVETDSTMGQVRKWVFIELSLWCKQMFPGKEKSLLGQLSLFGTSCSLPFKSSPLSKIALNARGNWD